MLTQLKAIIENERQNLQEFSGVDYALSTLDIVESKIEALFADKLPTNIVIEADDYIMD